MTPNATSKCIVLGITGASGAAYARRTLELLLAASVQVHLVISPQGQRLLHDELGVEKFDPHALRETVEPMDGCTVGTVVQHAHRDVGATIASGSFMHDGMIVVPCSSNSLAAIATGQAQNLLHRAAYVTLKEQRKLVLVHREMPLTLIDVRNMQSVIEAGGIVAPANPGFYMLPQSVDELVNYVAARCLDLVDVPHTLPVRWMQD